MVSLYAEFLLLADLRDLTTVFDLLQCIGHLFLFVPLCVRFHHVASFLVALLNPANPNATLA